MKIYELQNKIKEINPAWSINYSENIDYRDIYAQRARHNIEITVYKVSYDDSVKILEAGNDEFNDSYFIFDEYYAKGANITKILKLVQLLQDYLSNFKGYID